MLFRAWGAEEGSRGSTASAEADHGCCDYSTSTTVDDINPALP